MQFCEAAQIELSELDTGQLAQIAPELDIAVLQVLTITGSVASRDGRGGTAPARVAEQLVELREQAKGFASWANRAL